MSAPCLYSWRNWICSLGLGPKNTFSVALIDLTLMVDISVLLVGQKQDGREASMLGSSLYSPALSLQRKRGHIFLFSLRTNPGLGGCSEEQDAGWGGGWRRCCHHPTTHNTCLQDTGVWLLWNCSRLCPSLGPQFFPGFWTWVKTFRPAGAKKTRSCFHR